MIPTDRSRVADEQLLAEGFTLGELVPGDPLFQRATFPRGWKVEPTEHPMWSRILDSSGRERYKMFYKAAFYDRRAFMCLGELPSESEPLSGASDA